MKTKLLSLSPRLSRVAIAAACAAFFANSGHAHAQVVKANNATALNLGASWALGVVPGVTDVATWNNTVLGANTTVIGGNLNWQGISITDPGGTVTINGSTGFSLTLGSSGIDMSGATRDLTIAAVVALGSSQTWNVASGRTLQVNGGISGTGFGIVKSGPGTLTMNAASTYSGGLTVLAGAATSNNATGFGTGTITLGNALTNDAATISGSVNGTIANAINLATLSNGVLTIRGTNNTGGQTTTYSGAITVTSGNPTLQISQNNNGALTLSNATFNPTAAVVNVGTGTGIATISGAIGNNVTSITQTSPTSLLALTGNSTYNNGITIKAGTLRIGSANGGGAATNIITLGDTSGTAAATLQQNFGGTTQQPVVLATGTTGNLTIESPNVSTLGELSGGVTGTNNFRINASNTMGILFKTNPIANVGTVTNVGVGGGAAQILSNITNSVTNVTQNSATSVLRLSGTNTYGTSTITNGVLSFLTTSAMPGYPNPTGPNLITVSSGGTLALGYGAASGQFSNADIVALGSTGTPVSFAATGASLGLDTTSAVGGTATYNGVISDPTGVVLGFNKVGAGTLVLTGSNTYTGPTTISQGFLSAVPGVGIPAASNLQISGSGGTGVNTSGTFVPTVANFEIGLGTGGGQAQVLGTNSGFTSQLANQVVALGSIATPTALTWGSASFNPTALVLNETGATNTLDFRNPINFDAAARTVTVNATGTANAATLSGVLSSNTAAGGLTKTGGGILNVTNTANTYTGPTAVSGGTLSFNGTGALPAASTVTVNAGGTLQILNDASGTIAYGNTVNLSSTSGTINVGNNGGATTGSTVAFGALNAPATATNTTTTTVFNGSNGYGISFSSLALPGGNGATTTLTANTNVTILGNVTNRGTGGATNFDTLTLQGSATGSAINGIIADAATGSITTGNYTPVTKTGTGTWTLRGANTYTGNTTINGGTLALDGGAGGTIGGSLVNVNANGTLSIIGNTTIGNAAATLTATQGSVVVAGGTTTATRGTINLVDNAINSLTITGNNFATPAAQSLTLGGTTAGAFSALEHFSES